MIYFQFSTEKSDYGYDQIPGEFYGNHDDVASLKEKYIQEKDIDGEKRNIPRKGMLVFLAVNGFLPVSETLFYKA